MGLTGKASANNVNWLECGSAYSIVTADSRLICCFRPSAVIPVAVSVPLLALRPPFGTAGVGHIRTMTLSDIGIAPHVRPVLREHGPTKRIDLNLPLEVEPGPREAEIEAPDPGEQ